MKAEGDGKKYSWTAVFDLEECKGLNMKIDGVVKKMGQIVTESMHL